MVLLGEEGMGCRLRMGGVPGVRMGWEDMGMEEEVRGRGIEDRNWDGRKGECL